MPVPGAALSEGAAILDITVRPVQPAALAVAGRAVALQVAQMRRGGAAADFMAHDPRLDHHPPLTMPRAPLRRRALQPIGNGLAAPDARALSLPGHPAATPAARRPGGRQRAPLRLHRGPHDLIDKGERPAGSRASAIADAARARAEVESVDVGHDAQRRAAIAAQQAQTTGCRMMAYKNKRLGWSATAALGPDPKISVQTTP